MNDSDARALLDSVVPGRLDERVRDRIVVELQRARMARLRAHIVFARSRGSDAPPLLLDAAKRLEAFDVGLARDTYLEALGATIFVGRLGGPGGARAAEAARAAPPGPEPPRPTDLLLDGVATRFADGYVAGVEPLRRALLSLREQAGRNQGGVIRWLWTACPVAPEPMAPDLWDDEAWHELATAAVRLTRDAGALATLPIALSYRAAVHVHEGEFDAASALIQEADAITEATGNAPQHVIPLLERDGYTVTAVQNPLTSVADDIATTKRVIDAQPGPVVVVGHSYGGLVITGAASGSSKVKALVYVSAFAPDTAEPIGPLLEKYPSPSGAALRPDAAGFFYIDRAMFQDIFAKDVGAEEAAVMAATQKPLAGASFAALLTEPPAWKTIRSWFIVAQNDRVIHPDLERFFARRMGATTTEIASSHVPFISHPAEVVKVIEQAATAEVTAAGITDKH